MHHGVVWEWSSSLKVVLEWFFSAPTGVWESSSMWRIIMGLLGCGRGVVSGLRVVCVIGLEVLQVLLGKFQCVEPGVPCGLALSVSEDRVFCLTMNFES